MEELDAIGPYEVLGAWTQSHPDDGWSLVTLSRTGAAVNQLTIYGFDSLAMAAVRATPGLVEGMRQP